MIEKVSFKPRARILKLLGEQLIGNSKLAIFELVKNAYDADADSVKIVINSPEKKENCSIEVIDFGGTGMTKDTILNIWLEPGAEHRETQRKEGIRTPKYNRLPLGEKGVGRFAVHKLGNKIRINTKSINEPEYIIEVNWEDQLKNKYIDETNVLITEASDKDAVFINGTTGTKILISDLNETFDKKQIQELYQTINSINYPFEKLTIEDGLKFSVSAEHEEAERIYPEFAKIAREEGFEEIAKKFELTAKVERKHELTFKFLYENFKNGTLFQNEEPTFWECTECGHVEARKEAWNLCPLCNASQGFVKLKLN